MVKVRLFVEGGGTSKALNSICRRDFRKFIEKAKLTGRNPEIVLCGSRTDALDDFRNAPAVNQVVDILLVDAERPVKAPATDPKPWDHLKENPDNWTRPRAATDDQCHLMAQSMETWLLADVEALKKYYGQGFRNSALPRNPKIERIPKQDVIHGLVQASRATRKKSYRKGAQSFEILAELDPAKVRQQSPYADRFFRTLEQASEQ